MSYATKYYTEFKDYFDNLIRVDFDFKDYVGLSTELLSQEGTGQIYQVEEEKNIFKPIRGSEFSISLLCETNFQLLDFSVQGKRDVKVTVTKAGSTFWVGWLTPNQFSEPYIAPPYFVSVSALDGLGELKTYTWEDDFLLSPIWIIFRIISELDTELKIYESINIYEETMNATAADSPLNQCYWPSGRYIDYNYYEVLADILTGFGAEIQQVNGYWKIARIPEQKNDLIRRRWGRLGTTDLPALETNDTESTVKFIGIEQDNKLVNYSHELLVSPGVNKMKILKNSGRKKFFNNADFSKFSSIGLAEDWTFNNLTGSKKFLRNDTIQEINESSTNAVDAQSGYITQIIDNVKNITLSFGAIHALEFNIELAITKTNSNDLIASQSVRIVLEADSGTNYYLDADGSFSTSLTTITFKNITVNEPKDIQFNTLTITNAQVPEDGKIRIYIYKPYKISGTGSINKWYVKRVEGEIYSISGGYYDDFGNWESQNVPELSLINQNMTYVSDVEAEFIFGDFPNNDLIPIYHNGLFRTLLGDTPITGDWTPRNNPYTFTFPTLQNNLLIEYRDYFATPRWVIRGDILSQTINFDSTIVDYGISIKKYYVKGGRYNLRTSIFSGTFMEIGTWDDAPWILEDGTWNDDGVWIDSETWNDTDPTP